MIPAALEEILRTMAKRAMINFLIVGLIFG
jgi:hypothetical protein